MNREDKEVSKRFVWYSLLGFAVVIGMITTVYFLQPTWLGLERKAYKASHQYIEAKQSLLMKLASEHDKLEAEIRKYEASSVDTSRIVDGLKGQQKGLVERIREEAQRIPQKEIPPSVRRFLPKQ